MINKLHIIILSFLVISVSYAEISFKPTATHPETISMDCGKGKLKLHKGWYLTSIQTPNGEALGLLDPFFYQLKLGNEKDVYWLAPDGWKKLNESWKKLKFEEVPASIHKKENASILHMSMLYKNIKKDVWICAYPDEDILYISSKLSALDSKVIVNMDRQRLSFPQQSYDKILLDNKMIMKSSPVKNSFFLFNRLKNQSLAIIFDRSRKNHIRVKASLNNKANVQVYIYRISYKDTLVKKNSPLWQQYRIIFGDGDMSKDGRLSNNLTKKIDRKRFYMPEI